MSRTMTQREKVLSLVVGGSLAVIINLFIFDYFLSNHSRLRAERTRKTAQLRSMKMLLANSTLWEQREARLATAQPHLENRSTAGVQLLTQMTETAKRYKVSIEQPVIGPVEDRPGCTAATLEFDTKSTWGALVTLLQNLQAPENFIVIESSTLKVDPGEPTMMHGHFKISKWYAPKAPGDRS